MIGSRNLTWSLSVRQGSFKPGPAVAPLPARAINSTCSRLKTQWLVQNYATVEPNPVIYGLDVQLHELVTQSKAL